MRRPIRPAARLGLVAVAIAALGGCSSLNSSLEGKSVDYGSARASNQLDVPPDLTQLQRDPHYMMPADGHQQAVSAVAYQKADSHASDLTAQVLPEVPGMQLKIIDGQRWLVINNAAPDVLWPKVAAFWTQNGLNLAKTDQSAGLMETEWAENHAQLPLDIIRRTLGKALDTLYDTGERDQWRTVFLRTPDGHGTQILLTHQSMVEVFTTPDHSDTRWQPGKADPALDAVMLNRLMVALGSTEEKARALQAETPAPAPMATLVDGGRVLRLADGFDEAWRRVGVAVGGAGFTLLDRDRSAGNYDVRYVNPQAAAQQQATGTSFFSGLFGRGKSDKLAPHEFHIVVKAAGSGSEVTVVPVTPDAESTSSAQDILKVLQQQLQ